MTCMNAGQDVVDHSVVFITWHFTSPMTRIRAKMLVAVSYISPFSVTRMRSEVFICNAVGGKTISFKQHCSLRKSTEKVWKSFTCNRLIVVKKRADAFRKILHPNFFISRRKITPSPADAAVLWISVSDSLEKSDKCLVWTLLIVFKLSLSLWVTVSKHTKSFSESELPKIACVTSSPAAILAIDNYQVNARKHPTFNPNISAQIAMCIQTTNGKV